jgi:adenylate cyclase
MGQRRGVRVGVALHYGTVTWGNVGVDAQRDATIIGDAVNTVFRLKGLMKGLDKPVLLSANFRQLLSTDEDLVELGERRLKGKVQAMRV